MKSSRYNLYFPHLAGGDLILYNTLRGSVFFVNKEGRNAIENAAVDQIDSSLCRELIEQGVLIDDDVDELMVFRVRRDQAKYGGADLHFVILTTYLCNLRCTYCFVPSLWRHWEKPVPTGTLKGDTLERIIKFIKVMAWERNCSSIIIDFVGLGEPLLTADSIIATIKDLDAFTAENNTSLKVNIVSNGTFVTEELLNILSDYNICFHITLDGPKDIHDKRRKYENGKGTYDRILKSLSLIVNYGINFIIRVNVDNDNFDSINQLLDELIEKLGPGRSIRFAAVLPPSQEGPWVNSCMSGQELDKLPQLWTLASQKGFTVIMPPLISYLSCGAMKANSYVIDLFADVYKCEGLAGNAMFKIGTINENGRLSELSHSYYQWMAIDQLEVEDCKQCALLPICGGACPELLYHYTGNCRQTSCMHNKKLIMQRTEFFLNRIYR